MARWRSTQFGETTVECCLADEEKLAGQCLPWAHSRRTRQKARAVASGDSKATLRAEPECLLPRDILLDLDSTSIPPHFDLEPKLTSMFDVHPGIPLVTSRVAVDTQRRSCTGERAEARNCTIDPTWRPPHHHRDHQEAATALSCTVASSYAANRPLRCLSFPLGQCFVPVLLP